MKKSLLIGLVGASAMVLLSGCAKNSKQVYIESPTVNESKSVNEFRMKDLPQCPEKKEVHLSSNINSIEYIKSININDNEDGTQTTNTETDKIELGRKTFFSGCKNTDGSYSFKIVNENKELESLKKIVL